MTARSRSRSLAPALVVLLLLGPLARPAAAAEERGDRSADAFSLFAILGGVVVGLVVVALFALWVAVLVQALRIPDSEWERADQSKLIYVLLMVLLGLVGTVLYWLVARPALRRAGVPQAG